MRYTYIMKNRIQTNSDFYKKFFLFASFLFCIAISFYVNLYLKEDMVYTHIFYIPIILAVIWYGKKAIYLALYMGIFHISINYAAYGTLTTASMYRAVFFTAAAVIIYLITSISNDQPSNSGTYLVEDTKKGSPEERMKQINLAGKVGVAVGHEIRNPLTTVRGFLQFLGNKENYEEDQEYFSLMIEELDNANEAISNLINLADDKTSNMEKQNLNSIIDEFITNTSSLTAKFNIKVEFKFTDIPDLYLDKAETDKLILNLFNNSVEAMSPGGTITISTSVSGDEVLLAIHDNGSGIPSDVVENIGKPFFSTKESSAGLGLAVCYSIARRHNARIEFISNSSGTTFIVHFPQAVMS